MSANARPNLGGLFDGTTPPERSSSIAGALRAPEAGDRNATDASGSEASTEKPSSSTETRSTGSTHSTAPPGVSSAPRSTGPTRSTGSSGRPGSPGSSAASTPIGSARATRTTPVAATAAPPMGAPVPPLRSALGAGRDASDPWAALQWLDPVRVLGFYFDVLQSALDTQRRVTMTVASVVTAPVRRAGIWR